MPVSERITPPTAATTRQQSTPPLPSQQEFHAYLRSFAQSVVRTMIEVVMREEQGIRLHKLSLQ